MPFAPSKRRVLAGSRDEHGNETPAVLASATPTNYPGTFPPAPNASGRAVFEGDMQGAKIVGARWDMSVMTTFTAADCKLQTSPNGVDWADVDGGGFTQKAGVGSEEIYFDIAADDVGSGRFWRAEIDMTGTPGTSSHLVELLYVQKAGRGNLAPPGRPARTS